MAQTVKKNVPAKVTISRSNNDAVTISINDGLSGLLVAEVEMSLEECALAATGLARTPCRLVSHIEDAGIIGMKRITKSVQCDKVNSIGDRKAQHEAVMADFQKHWANAWSLHNDGLGSQQHGERHTYTIIRFEPPDGE